MQNNFFLKISSTRMHSSRMPTTHFNSHLGAVSASGWGSRGVVCLWVQGLVSASVSRGCLDRHPPWADPPGQTSPFSIACWDAHPLPVNRITGRCKNITFPHFCLRAVINLPQNCLYDHMSFQCYELTRRYSHLLL